MVENGSQQFDMMGTAKEAAREAFEQGAPAARRKILEKFGKKKPPLQEMPVPKSLVERFDEDTPLELREEESKIAKSPELPVLKSASEAPPEVVEQEGQQPTDQSPEVLSIPVDRTEKEAMAKSPSIVGALGKIVYTYLGESFGVKAAGDMVFALATGEGGKGIKHRMRTGKTEGALGNVFGDLVTHGREAHESEQERQTIEQALVEVITAANARREQRKKLEAGELHAITKAGENLNTQLKEKIGVFKESLEESKYIPPQEKTELKRRLTMIYGDCVAQAQSLDTDKTKEVKDVVELYVDQKVTGMSVWRSSLNSLLVAVKLPVVRGMLYGAMSAVERGEKAAKAWEKEYWESSHAQDGGSKVRKFDARRRGLPSPTEKKGIFIVKDTLLNACRETVRGLTWQGERSGLYGRKVKKTFEKEGYGALSVRELQDLKKMTGKSGLDLLKQKEAERQLTVMSANKENWKARLQQAGMGVSKILLLVGIGGAAMKEYQEHGTSGVIGKSVSELVDAVVQKKSKASGPVEANMLNTLDPLWRVFGKFAENVWENAKNMIHVWTNPGEQIERVKAMLGSDEAKLNLQLRAMDAKQVQAITGAKDIGKLSKVEKQAVIVAQAEMAKKPELSSMIQKNPVVAKAYFDSVKVAIERVAAEAAAQKHAGAPERQPETTEFQPQSQPEQAEKPKVAQGEKPTQTPEPEEEGLQAKITRNIVEAPGKILQAVTDLFEGEGEKQPPTGSTQERESEAEQFEPVPEQPTTETPAAQPVQVEGIQQPAKTPEKSFAEKAGDWIEDAFESDQEVDKFLEKSGMSHDDVERVFLGGRDFSTITADEQNALNVLADMNVREGNVQQFEGVFQLMYEHPSLCEPLKNAFLQAGGSLNPDVVLARVDALTGAKTYDLNNADHVREFCRILQSGEFKVGEIRAHGYDDLLKSDLIKNNKALAGLILPGQTSAVGHKNETIACEAVTLLLGDKAASADNALVVEAYKAFGTVRSALGDAFADRFINNLLSHCPSPETRCAILGSLNQIDLKNPTVRAMLETEVIANNRIPATGILKSYIDQFPVGGRSEMTASSAPGAKAEVTSKQDLIDNKERDVTQPTPSTATSPAKTAQELIDQTAADRGVEAGQKRAGAPPVISPEKGAQLTLEIIEQRAATKQISSDTMVQKNDGPTHVIKRQIDDLIKKDPQKWGFKGDVNNTAALDRFAARKSFDIAAENRLIKFYDANNKEISFDQIRGKSMTEIYKTYRVSEHKCGSEAIGRTAYLYDEQTGKVTRMDTLAEGGKDRTDAGTLDKRFEYVDPDAKLQGEEEQPLRRAEPLLETSSKRPLQEVSTSSVEPVKIDGNRIITADGELYFDDEVVIKERDGIFELTNKQGQKFYLADLDKDGHVEPYFPETGKAGKEITDIDGFKKDLAEQGFKLLEKKYPALDKFGEAVLRHAAIPTEARMLLANVFVEQGFNEHQSKIASLILVQDKAPSQLSFRTSREIQFSFADALKEHASATLPPNDGMWRARDIFYLKDGKIEQTLAGMRMIEGRIQVDLSGDGIPDKLLHKGSEYYDKAFAEEGLLKGKYPGVLEQEPTLKPEERGANQAVPNEPSKTPLPLKEEASFEKTLESSQPPPDIPQGNTGEIPNQLLRLVHNKPEAARVVMQGGKMMMPLDARVRDTQVTIYSRKALEIDLRNSKIWKYPTSSRELTSALSRLPADAAFFEVVNRPDQIVIESFDESGKPLGSFPVEHQIQTSAVKVARGGVSSI